MFLLKYVFGFSAMRLLLPYISVLRFLTRKSKGRTVEFVLDVNVLMKLEFSSLIVLNISIVSGLILLIFIDSLPLLSRKV